ncbi:uncharacterized protein LOC134832740 [Culicoides brevitarsis]|uniref:uncharacterized protein LOC134832740 n=1 Tax=Culicoides brevitarsis TaxID=469753 RepID=UPI00307CBFCE
MEIERGMPKWTNNNRVPPLNLSSVSVCPSETEKRWNTATQVNIVKRTENKKTWYGMDDGLPVDPRDWTRTDVWKWLTTMARNEGLDISNELADKFPMNGKALCLMSLEMYLNRVPIGGKMLYRDFRVRLARAMALYSNN